MWGKTGINCFVLITGYFMCKSQITLRKFLKLLLQIEFYNILINAVFVLTGYKAFGLNVLYEMFWPIKGVADGFTSCFLLFYLCIPFLNVLVHNLDKKKTYGSYRFVSVHLYSIGNDIKNTRYDELRHVVLRSLLYIFLHQNVWLGIW